MPFLDDALCDALALRKEMHPGMFAVMDGVFAEKVRLRGIFCPRKRT